MEYHWSFKSRYKYPPLFDWEPPSFVFMKGSSTIETQDLYHNITHSIGLINANFHFHTHELSAEKYSSLFDWKPTSFTSTKGCGTPSRTVETRFLYHDMFHLIGSLIANRIGIPHALQKDLCSHLSRVGMDRGTFAIADRWKIRETIFLYTVLNEAVFIRITRIYFKIR
eukprot:942004_1